MYSKALLLFFLLLGIIRYFNLRIKSKPANYVLVGIPIQMFSLNKSFFSIELASSKDMFPWFGTSIGMESALVLSVLFFIFGYRRFDFEFLRFSKNNWILISLSIILISFINSDNLFKTGTFVFFAYIMQLILLLNLIKSNFTKSDVVYGIYDGLIIVGVVELFFAICYPVLGMHEVTTFFSEGAAEWSLRRDTPSAVGTFTHPGPLGLYSLLAMNFFISCYLNGWKKRGAAIMLLIYGIVLFLTNSRTSFITVIITLFLQYYVFKNPDRLLSIKKITYSLLLASIFLILLYLTPISEMFIKSDLSEQGDNRMIHWFLGFQIWEKAKLLGVGINAHVNYMYSHPFLLKINALTSDGSFFYSNPIHNIHIIVLVETGLLGIVFWLYYIFSRFICFTKKCCTPSLNCNILNLSFVGILLSMFLYGFTGWSPLNKELLSTALFIMYFSDSRIMNQS